MNNHHFIRFAPALAFLGTGAGARAQAVVVGNNSAAGPNSGQIIDIYTGKSQLATPLEQPESAQIRADFYKKAIGKDSAQMKALWARLTFIGKAQPPKEVADHLRVTSPRSMAKPRQGRGCANGLKTTARRPMVWR